MTDDVVPFGKYRGQPIERLIVDQNYCEWLVQQDWFTRQYPNLKVLVMRGVAPEQADTPDHNAMQAEFLNPDFEQEVVSRFVPGYSISKVEFEVHGWDVAIIGQEVSLYVELKPSVSDDYPVVLRQIKANIARLRVEWEKRMVQHHGRDFNKRGLYRYESYCNDRYALICNTFSSEAVTQEQMIEIFKASGISVWVRG